MKHALSRLLAVSLVGLAGCSTVLTGRYQEFELVTECQEISVVAECTLRNEHGTWKTKTPNRLVIQRGYSDLEITCKGAGLKPHTVRLASHANWSHYANVLNLGTLALVDVHNGAGYAYPSSYAFSVDQSLPVSAR